MTVTCADKDFFENSADILMEIQETCADEFLIYTSVCADKDFLPQKCAGKDFSLFFHKIAPTKNCADTYLPALYFFGNLSQRTFTAQGAQRKPEWRAVAKG